jgi:hypothetical protein
MPRQSHGCLFLTMCILAIIAAGGLTLVNATSERSLTRWDGLKTLQGSATLQAPAPAPMPASTVVPTSPATAPVPPSADAFTLEISPELYPDQTDQLRDASAQAFAEVVARVNKGQPPAVTAEILLDYSCALRGVAHPDFKAVQVYSCDSIDPSRAITILAHEFVHQIAYDYYGAAVEERADGILAEGLATWGAGHYWLGGYDSFRSFVRDQRRAGVTYPLAMSHVGQDFAVMDALYYQWASLSSFSSNIQLMGHNSMRYIVAAAAASPAPTMPVCSAVT